MTLREAGKPWVPLSRAAGVEALLTGAVGLCVVTASMAVAPGSRGVAGVVLAILMLAIAVVDRHRMVIPNQLNALAFVSGLAEAGLQASAGSGEAIANALLRGAVMFGVFLAFRTAYRKLRGIEGMGLGDVKLAGVAGVWVDWPFLPLVVDIAALSALAIALFGRVRGKRYSLMSKLPFGACFAPAIWICWLLATWRGA